MIVIRVGFHAGDVDRRGNDLSGIAVHIAARVNAVAWRLFAIVP